jgi:peptidoglycan/LPS O-acetylase OafA/YrhL
MNVRIKELDGLRGIAILLVMAFHIFKRAAYFTKHETLLFISELSYIGWMGVDIFFCLSGFLITSILLRTKTDAHYFRNFYARRILRIFPLYYFVIIVISILLPWLDPGHVPSLPVILPFLLTYLQNWMEFFKIASLPLSLGITWSLAIEEQFYFMWPAVVYYNTTERLIKICLGIISLSFIARAVSIFFTPDTQEIASFFYPNLLTRFEELAFGALLGILMSHPNWKERIRSSAFLIFLLPFSAFGILCITLFPSLVPYYSDFSLTLWAYTLIPIFSAGLIAMLVTHPEGSPLRRLFRSAPLQFFGKYSYAMYLLHMPITLVLVDLLDSTHLKGWRIYFGYIFLVYAITAVLSLITWNLLEKPMLNLKKYFEYN